MKLPTLQSERLICKPLSLEHLSVQYVEWMNDDEVNKYLESGGDYSIDKLEEFLSGVETRNILFWAIHLKENNKHIGNIKVDPIDKVNNSGEYGILLGDKTEWNKGYAKESTRLIIDYCFDRLGFDKITLGVKTENTAALELYKKMGFSIYDSFTINDKKLNKESHIVRMMILNNKTSKLCLGTVQFGINYGISNSNGIPSDDNLKEIFFTAKQEGIHYLDTAQAYGNAETRISTHANDEFEIISKFPAVSTAAELESALSLSLKQLNTQTLYGYLAHNADILIEHPELWNTLVKAKKDGKVKKIGFSLYTPEQLDKLLKLNLVPDLVQLPYSIFDRKFEDQLSVLKKLGTEIHVRSVFLQGLYFMDPERLPVKLQAMGPSLVKLQETCKEKNISIAQAAINYVASNHKIDKIVIGLETVEQLKENISLIKTWKPNPALFAAIEAISINDTSLLNPVNWQK